MNARHHSGPAAAGGLPRSAARAGGEELWLFTLDHRRQALLYAAVVGVALCVGAFLALGLAAQPLAGRDGGAGVETFRQVYSMHGLVLVFLVALPAIPGVLANALLPGLLGVERAAWPRLNLLALHLFAAGCALFLVAALAAPSDAGWSFDVPFSVASGAGLGWSVLAIVLVSTSVVCGGANLLATVAASRGGWRRMPLAGWAFATAALVQTLAAPVLVGAVVVLFAQRAGAADVLGDQHVAADVRFAAWFWAWAHPAITAVVLAALGAVSHVVGAHARAAADEAPDRAEPAAVLSLFALALLGACGSGVHLVGREAAPAAAAAPSALALLAGVPFTVLVLGWIRALARGATRFTSALAYALASITLVAAGLLCGAFLAVPPTGVYLQNTTFVSAQLHLLLAGGALGALLAGLHHLWPRWFGAPVREGLGLAACALWFAGVLLAFVPGLALGYLGQPRRGAELVEAAAGLTTLSAVGSVVVVVALLLAGWNLLQSALQGNGEGAP